MFEALGRLALARRWLVIWASVAVLVVSGAVILRGGSLTSGDTHGTEAYIGRRLLDTELHLPGASSFTVVFSSDTLYADDPAYVEAMQRALPFCLDLGESFEGGARCDPAAVIWCPDCVAAVPGFRSPMRP